MLIQNSNIAAATTADDIQSLINSTLILFCSVQKYPLQNL